MPPGVLKLRQDSQRKLVSFQVSIQVASFLLEPEILDIFLKIVILHVVQGTVENANMLIERRPCEKLRDTWNISAYDS